MIAYMVNDHYVFTSYEELSSLIHDIVHHTVLPAEHRGHLFSIYTGILDKNDLVFTNEHGRAISLRYEADEDIYYSA